MSVPAPNDQLHALHVVIGAGQLGAAIVRGNPTLREMRETYYQFAQPFVVDHTKYPRAFGVDITPHEEAVRRTMAWYRAAEGGEGDSQGGAAPASYTMEREKP